MSTNKYGEFYLERIKSGHIIFTARKDEFETNIRKYILNNLEEVEIVLDINDSYIKLLDNRVIKFNIINTPMENFNKSGLLIEINNNIIHTYDIKEIIFGNSYSNVISFGNYFLYRCSNLEKLDISSFNKIETIGNDFLRNCSKLDFLDMQYLINLKTIGNNFLYGCSSLNHIYIGKFGSEWSNVSVSTHGLMKEVQNNSDCILGFDSELQSTEVVYFLIAMDFKISQWRWVAE